MHAIICQAPPKRLRSFLFLLFLAEGCNTDKNGGYKVGVEVLSSDEPSTVSSDLYQITQQQEKILVIAAILS